MNTLHIRPYYEHRYYPAQIPFCTTEHTNLFFFAHYHPEIEIVTVLSGTITMRIDDAIVSFSEGETIIIPPKHVHSYELGENTSRVILLIFDPSMLLIPYLHLEHPQEPICLQKPSSYSEQVKESYQKTIEHLISLSKKKDLSDPTTLCIALGELFETYGRLSNIFLTHGIPLQATSSVGTEQTIVKNMLLFIDSHYREPISLIDLAQALNYSYAYLSKLCKKSLGVDFSTYVKTKRVMYAIQLLKQSNMSIGEVCFASGFQSIRTCNRAFLETCGKSPSSVRNGL